MRQRTTRSGIGMLTPSASEVEEAVTGRLLHRLTSFRELRSLGGPFLARLRY